MSRRVDVARASQCALTLSIATSTRATDARDANDARRRERRETCRAESRRRARRSAVARDDRDMSSTARDSAPTDRTTTTTNAEATAETPREEEGAYESALRRVMSNLTDEGSLEAALRDAASAVARGRGRARDGDRFATTTTTTATMGDDVERDGETEGMVSSSPRTTTATTGTRALLEEMDADEETRAAEQSRLASALSAAERGTPMVALFLMIFVYKNFAALAFAGWLVYVLMRVNAKLVRCVSEREERKTYDVAVAAGTSTTHAAVIWLFSPTGRRARRLFQPSATGVGGGFVESLWDVIILDLWMRFAFVSLKIAVVALPFSVLQRAVKRSHASTTKLSLTRVYRRRASFLSAVEYANLIFRSCVPVPIWLAYFKRELPSFLASFVTGLYVVFKLKGLVQRGSDFFKASAAWMGWQKHALAHGEAATREDLMEAGDVCAICQEECVDATKLRCSHIFCQDCIGEWFDRQPARGTARAGTKTCPVCRAVVQNGVQRSYGNGETAMMPIVF